MNLSRSVRYTLQEPTQFTKANFLASHLRRILSNSCSATSLRLSQVAACAVALGLLLGATQGYAATLIWTNGSGVFSAASNWDPAQAPADTDNAIFTNDATYTISFTGNSPLMDTCTFTNHAGTATLNVGGNKWSVTNALRIARADGTSTVYLASGTLSVAGMFDTAESQLRIGDAATNGFHCSGTLVVTNGTVVIDSATVGAAISNSTAFGKLVITGSGKMIDNGSGSTLTIGAGGEGAQVDGQLIVTNGGLLTVDGTLTVGNNRFSENAFALFSGPTSRGTMTSQGIAYKGNGGVLIVSNGAKLFMVGNGTFGANSSYNTGVVVGVGSSFIVNGDYQVGVNSGGGTNNFFIVYDGATFTCGGSLQWGNNSRHVNDGISFGGPGLPITASAVAVRSSSVNTNHFGNFVTVTNASFSCGYLNPQGPEETVSILANGTWKMTNSFSVRSDTNNVRIGGRDTSFIVDGGTFINLLSADNGGGIDIGTSVGSVVYPGTHLVVTNGGKMLTSMGTIGGGGSMLTGIVTGVGSVWSNYSGPAGFTNMLIVGTNEGGSNNFLGVFDGGTLYNNGTLAIGNNTTATVNTVQFGGLGATSVVVNTGSIEIGSAAATFGNTLIVTNAMVTCGSIFVGRPTMVTSNYTFTTNDVNAGLVVTNFCTTTNDLIATVLTNCTPTITASSPSNVLTVSSGTLNAGVIRVAPANTLVYSGGTLIFTNLRVDGIMTGAATLNVPSGSTLQGVGSIANPVTVANGGTVAPGTSVGTLTISNNLVLNSTSVLRYELGSTASADKMVVVGALTLDGVLSITTNNTDGSFGIGNYTLITYTGALTDNGLTVGTTPDPGLNYAIVAGSGSVVLQVTSGGGGDPYSTWANFYGLGGGNAAGGADPDGDAMINTNEFLAGFNPSNSSAFLHIISVVRTSGTNVTLTYLGANGDSNGSSGPKTNILEFTTGTANGSYTNNYASAGVTNILSGGSGLGQMATMVHTNGATGPTRYYRIRVLVP
jgi:hypothetical protein